MNAKTIETLERFLSEIMEHQDMPPTIQKAASDLASALIHETPTDADDKEDNAP